MQLVINVSDSDLEYIRNMYDILGYIRNMYGIQKDISVSIAEALLNGRKIPPHGRLIAEKTITEIRYHDADGYHIVNGEQLCELEIDADTIIEAEGVNT